MRIFSEKAVLLDLPFEKQVTPNLCGLAAVEMLTRYHKKPLSEKLRQHLKDHTTEEGVSGQVVRDTLREAGYQAYVFAGKLSRDRIIGIYDHLDKNRPLMVMIKAEENSHFCMVHGYDEENGLIACLDPSKGPIAITLEKFEGLWKNANYFTLLAVPKSSASD